MIAVSNVRRRARKQRLKQLLALRQLDGAQVEAVEIEQVEHEIDEVGGRRSRQRVLQRLEAAAPLLIERHDFAVEPRGLHRQARGRARNRRKVRGPVLSIARDHPRRAFGNAAQHPVAVVLDLVDPVRADGRVLDQRRELGFDEIGKRRLARAGHLADAGQRFRLRDGAGFDVRRDRLVGMPDAVAARGDFLETAAGGDAVRHVVGDRCGLAQTRVFVGFLEEQPTLAAVFAAAAAHEVPASVQLLAVELELETAFLERFLRIALGNPRAAVPEHHGARAVLLRRNHAFEIAVLDRVIFDVHREPLVVGIEARSFRHRPTEQHAVELEPEVVVKAPRRVLLDDEFERRFRALPDLPFRLGGDAEIPLLAIAFEAHSVSKLV